MIESKNNELPSTPSFKLVGRRAIVVGAGRGIGMACAAALADAGAEVTLLARSEEQIESVAALIRAAGGQASVKVMDVSKLEDVEQFFRSENAFDIVVNSAGTNRPKSILDVTESDYDAVIDLNLKSLVFVSKAAIQRMIEQDVKGSVIHISSQMGHVGGPERTLYCASKWAVEGFNKALALDVAEYGIRSNTIAPTFIDTPLTRPFFEDKEFMDRVLGKIKLGRLGQVDDLMGAVIFLASDASGLMTGSSMVIDGGWTAD